MLFRIGVADPDWTFGNRRATRKDNPHQKTRFGIGVTHRYNHSTGGTAALCAMGEMVKSIFLPDSYMFMWACSSMRRDAEAVLEAWGFRVATDAFIWAKKTKHGKWSPGPGHYTQNVVEPVILGVRGRMWHTNKGYPSALQLLDDPRPCDENGGEIHSAKPETMQDRVDRWLGPQLKPGEGRLELFARRHRSGWVCVGGDLSGNDIREELAEMALPYRLDSRKVFKIFQNLKGV